jgi:colanic acid/amylovoran biosynthesis protein
MESVPATSDELIARVGTCRIVVTGSYHAGVFALSQGIPAVCVFNCEYYENKFRGLAAQFGVGCTVIGKSSEDFTASLVDSIIEAWENAEHWRPPLLEAARAQVEAGQVACNDLWERMNIQAPQAALTAFTE